MHLIDVLRGRDSERAQQWGHDQLAVFGLGADLDEGAWRGVFRQLAALGFIRADHEAYGALKLTEASRPVLKGETRIEMRRTVKSAPKSVKSKRMAPPPVAAAVDQSLFGRLKAWRSEQAKLQGVPAYVIFHDRTLAAIAAQRPHDLPGLSLIDGVGEKKLDRYGRMLLEFIGQEDAYAVSLGD
jgi:ATP-dependent DNA helicase RecQ